MKEEKYIQLSHGNGGQMMQELIRDIFLKHFGNGILNRQTDAAQLPANSSELAFTTDSFVIDPLFFPGGNIGKLAVCGTVNDLAVCGAEPLYLSVSFILEEGLPVSDLETVAESLASEARKAGVLIVTGDTKVVNRGKCDKMFINTAGIGHIKERDSHLGKDIKAMPGDVIIINGNIGDHGMAVLNARESFNFSTKIESDCASLNFLIRELLDKHHVKFMRDPTRGGVATVLNEIAGKIDLGIEIDEASLPVSNGVRAMCEILGYDPLYIANEGKVIVLAGEEIGTDILETMKKNVLGKECKIIGKIVTGHPGKVVIRNQTGSGRIVDHLTGDQLPRIC